MDFPGSINRRDRLGGEVDLKLKDKKVPQTREGFVKEMQDTVPFINYVTSGSTNNYCCKEQSRRNQDPVFKFCHLQHLTKKCTFFRVILKYF